jgi:hypothetical protein
MQCEEMEEAFELDIALPVYLGYLAVDVNSKSLNDCISHLMHFALKDITVLFQHLKSKARLRVPEPSVYI